MDYLGADGLHLAFQFSFLKADWSLESLRSTIEETLAFAADSDSPASWVLSNHDEPRHVTRYAPIDETGQPDLGRGRARARSLLMVMATLPGTVTLYNGEELGLYEVTDLPDDVRQDPAFFRQPPESTYKGRDGCRVPLPWTAQRPNAGFTTGEPWLPMPEDWPDLSVEVQAEDPESMLNFYRQTLRLRKATLAGRGEVTVLNLGDALLAYDVQLDGTVHRIVVNLSETGQAVDLEGWTMTLTSSSQAMEANRLLPDGAVWVTKEA
jgi:alpha-glucosidase